jgi:archaellum component FlaC
MNTLSIKDIRDLKEKLEKFKNLIENYKNKISQIDSKINNFNNLINFEINKEYQILIKNKKNLEKIIANYEKTIQEIRDLEDIFELSNLDQDLRKEINENYKVLQKKVDNIMIELLLDEEYDS